jgi:hypothetical protein
MCGHVDVQPARLEPAILQPLFELCNRIVWARGECEIGRIDRGDVQRKIADGFAKTRFIQVDRQHRALGRRFEELSAQGDDRQRVFERQRAGNASGRVFARAVADHRRGLDTPALPQAGNRVFEDEERRDRVTRSLQGRLARIPIEHRFAQIGRRVRWKPREALVDRPCEHGLRKQFATCAGVVRPTAWEHEDDARRLGAGPGRDASRMRLGLQHGAQLLRVLRDHGAAMLEFPPARLQCVRGIGDVEARRRLREEGYPLCLQPTERGGCAR